MAAADDNYDIPYVPSSDERLEVMLQFAKPAPGLKSLDLGAGDGRVVMAMARAGAQALGIEVDPDRAKMANDRLRQAGLSKSAKVRNGNFWDQDFGAFDIITVYGIRGIMPGLEKKFLDQAKPGCRMVCNYFYFPGLRPAEVKDYVLLYIK